MGEISKEFDPDILFLMETKNPNEFVMKKLEHLRYDCSHLVPPTGHGAGGLGLFWNQDLNLQILESSPNVIDTLIEFEGKQFYSSFVYGNPDRTQRKLLWDHLLSIATAREAPWFITGDLNDILCGDEKDGVLSDRRDRLRICVLFSRREISLIYSTREIHCLGEASEVITWSDADWTERRQTPYGRSASQQLDVNILDLRVQIICHS